MQEDHLHGTETTDWGPIILLTLLFSTYLASVLVMQNRGKLWSTKRTVSFIAGCSLAIAAFSPLLAEHAHHDLRVHMVQHLLVGMLAPLGLVLGAPLTLLLRILKKDVARKVTGIIRSRFFHFLSHPVTALILNIGGMYVLYLTPLYKIMLENAAIHYLVHFHFLAAGYLFVWSIAGPDPAPRRPSFRFRFAVLFISMATHAYLSKFMYAHEYPVNTHHSLEQIQDAAIIMYYGGDLTEALLGAAFFSIWYKSRKSFGRRKGAAFSKLL